MSSISLMLDNQVFTSTPEAAEVSSWCAHPGGGDAAGRGDQGPEVLADSTHLSHLNRRIRSRRAFEPRHVLPAAPARAPHDNITGPPEAASSITPALGPCASAWTPLRSFRCLGFVTVKGPSVLILFVGCSTQKPWLMGPETSRQDGENTTDADPRHPWTFACCAAATGMDAIRRMDSEPDPACGRQPMGYAQKSDVTCSALMPRPLPQLVSQIPERLLSCLERP